MILAFTTSTDNGGVALIEASGDRSARKILGRIQWKRGPQMSEALLPKINSLMKKWGVKPADLSAIAVDRGPGSFTGSRIAVNVAKTMAYSLAIPALSFSSLEILAGEIAFAPVKGQGKFKKPEKILSIMDAHRSLAYVQLFEIQGSDAVPASHATAEPLSRIMQIAAGNFESRAVIRGLPPQNFLQTFAENGLEVDEVTPAALTLALLAARALPAVSTAAQTIDQSWRLLEPTYIRAPDAVEKLQRK